MSLLARPPLCARRALRVPRALAPRTHAPRALSTAPQPHDTRTKAKWEWGHAALPLGLALAAYAYTVSGASSGAGSDAGESSEGLIPFSEVQKHNSPEHGIWVVIHGSVYDLTEFIGMHPGGRGPILQHAGTDATDAFDPIHPGDAIAKNLPAEKKLGEVDPRTLPVKQVSEAEKARLERLHNLPPLDRIINLDDFEKVAHSVLTPQGWGYYRSGSDDEATYTHNRQAWGRVWFRPRILVPVAEVDTSTTLLAGSEAEIQSSAPFYISPAAAAKLGHPQGELNLTRAAADQQIVQGISANASCGLGEILAAREANQPVFYQLYLNKDRAQSAAILKEIQREGVSAVMLTCDSVVLGNREYDARAQGKGSTSFMSGGSTYFDANMTWDDVKWIKEQCSLPLFLKGVQCVEDVQRAAELGVRGVVLSNHGGRSLDYAPSGVDVLIELRQKHPELLSQLDVYVDGGVRRGSDVLKALALGAKAVGLGRPFLFANSGYGEEGVQHAMALLKAEVARDMRLLGVRSLDELTPERIEILPRVFAQGTRNDAHTTQL